MIKYIGLNGQKIMNIEIKGNEILTDCSAHE